MRARPSAAGFVGPLVRRLAVGGGAGEGGVSVRSGGSGAAGRLLGSPPQLVANIQCSDSGVQAGRGVLRGWVNETE